MFEIRNAETNCLTSSTPTQKKRLETNLTRIVWTANKVTRVLKPILSTWLKERHIRHVEFSNESAHFGKVSWNKCDCKLVENMFIPDEHNMNTNCHIDIGTLGGKYFEHSGSTLTVNGDLHRRQKKMGKQTTEVKPYRRMKQMILK